MRHRARKLLEHVPYDPTQLDGEGAVVVVLDEEQDRGDELRIIFESRNWNGVSPATEEDLNDVIDRYGDIIHVVVERVAEGFPDRDDSKPGGIAVSPYDDIFRRRLPDVPRVLITGYDGPLLERTGCHYFITPVAFEDLAPVVKALIHGADVLPGANRQLIARVGPRIAEVNDQLLAYLAQHPNELKRLHWRKFEELVAHLLEKAGFSAELQRGTKDGGVDVVATKSESYGDLMLLVQCKQSRNTIGVHVVRELYGVTTQRNASVGILATTSYFSPAANEFRETVNGRLSLRDFDTLRDWIAKSAK